MSRSYLREEGETTDAGASKTAETFLAEQYRLHANRVFRRCLAMGGGDDAWAADVTQEVFLRMIEHEARLDKNRDLASYLLTIADRLCIDKLRRERGVWPRVRDALLAARGTTPPAQPVLVDPDPDLTHLRHALGALPAKEHAAVVMKYVEGRQQGKIAEALECSEGYVSKLLTKAIARLRSEWKARS